MAVTATFQRTSHTSDVSTFREFATASLSGTYATGGFTSNPFAITGGLGSSPLPGNGKVRSVTWRSPSGYEYRSTVAGNVMTTKILSSAGNELANGTAVPDATVELEIVKSK